MHGCGNDFVIINNFECKIPIDELHDLAIRVCKRGFGVGADGLIVLDKTPPNRVEDYIWHFYNADGTEGEMCGNGARCTAWLANHLGIAAINHTLGTKAGTVQCKVIPELEEVKVELTKPFDLKQDIEINIDDKPYTAHFVNTGVPHAVIIVDDVTETDVKAIGKAVRYHDQFNPAGTNVNFVQVVDQSHLLVRTYERGVEEETYACGTGCCASVIIAQQLNLTNGNVITRTHGGFDLSIELIDGTPYLRGPVELVFEGTFMLKPHQ